MLSRYKKDGKIEPDCQDVILNTRLVVDYDPFFIFKILDHFHYLLTDPRKRQSLHISIHLLQSICLPYLTKILLISNDTTCN